MVKPPGAAAVKDLHMTQTPLAGDTKLARVARLLDPAAYHEWADGHIQWCEHYKMRLDRDLRDWNDHATFGQQFAQRRREAETKAADIIRIVMEPQPHAD